GSARQVKELFFELRLERSGKRRLLGRPVEGFIFEVLCVNSKAGEILLHLYFSNTLPPSPILPIPYVVARFFLTLAKIRV
ncbi:MAG: hypothetical protein ACQEQ7_11590, partial [Thermodesulfobacteriota bacterium]